jgi:hypothetical protein
MLNILDHKEDVNQNDIEISSYSSLKGQIKNINNSAGYFPCPSQWSPAPSLHLLLSHPQPNVSFHHTSGSSVVTAED